MECGNHLLRKRRTTADHVDGLVENFLGMGCEGVALGVLCTVPNELRDPSTPARYAKVVGEVDLFPLASLTKTFVGAVAVIYAQQPGARLGLDDDICKVLDDPVRNPNFPDTSITLRQLLSHRASLADDETALGPFSAYHTRNADSPICLEEYVRGRLVPGGKNYMPTLWNARRRPGVAPHHYSNAGITLAAFVLECAALTSFHSLADDLLFEPLGMQHTTLSVTQMASQNDLRHPQHFFGPAEWPAAGGWSTLDNMMHYLEALLTQRAPLTSAVAVDLFPASGKDGLGWWGRTAPLFTKDLREIIPGEAWVHGGHMQGVRSFICVWPTKGKAMVVLTSGQEDLTSFLEAIVKQFHL